VTPERGKSPSPIRKYRLLRAPLKRRHVKLVEAYERRLNACRALVCRRRVTVAAPTPVIMAETRNELYARLFSESRAALRRYVKRFVRSGETAEEIVQEAFLRTYAQGDGVKTPRAFLFSTARNLASNEHRHRCTVKTDSVGDFDDSRVVRQSGSPEEDALADERTRLVQDAVDRLPPQCRAAFTLRVFHGCSYKEIAGRLGISAKTVEKHIARGLRETHEYMKRRYKDVSSSDG